MSKRKTILYSILIVAIIASYEYVLVPLEKLSDEINREYNTKFDNNSRYERNQIVLKKGKELHDEYAREISEIVRQEKLVPDVQQEIAKLVGAVGMNMVQIDAMPEARRGDVKGLSLAVKATGDYPQVLKLLDEVLLLPRLINVRKMSLENLGDGAKDKSGGALRLDMELEYYSAREETHPPLAVEYVAPSAEEAVANPNDFAG